MIAIPAPLVVQRHEKQIGALQGFQNLLAIVFTGQRITQRTGQLIQNGRFLQKRLHMRRLLMQHLFQQVIQHEAVAAGEGLDEIGHIFLAAHGECGHLQPGNPTFGARFQGSDLIRW